MTTHELETHWANLRHQNEEGYMSKHTYGFHTDEDKGKAVTDALARAREDGFVKEGQKFTVEVVETAEHRMNNEFAVVIRTDEDAS